MSVPIQIAKAKFLHKKNWPTRYKMAGLEKKN